MDPRPSSRAPAPTSCVGPPPNCRPAWLDSTPDFFRPGADVDYASGDSPTSIALEDRTLIGWRRASERRIRVLGLLVVLSVVNVLAITVGPSTGQERLVSKR